MARPQLPDQAPTPDRFPVIGRHLISENNPAYAPTEPPNQAPPAPVLAPRRRMSFIAQLYLELRRLWR